MPEFNADFSQSRQFIVLPRGVYNAHVAAAELKKASTSGDPMIAVRMEIDEVVSLQEGAEYSEEQCVGQSVFANLMLAGEGAGITQSAFQAMFGSVEEAPKTTEELVGAACSIRITHRVYEGEQRANISRWEPLASPMGGAAPTTAPTGTPAASVAAKLFRRG